MPILSKQSRPFGHMPSSRGPTEGVGFEPTVGFPTLDFESSALNRTQPPFLSEQKKVEPCTSNIQRRTQISCANWRFGVKRWASAFICLVILLCEERGCSTKAPNATWQGAYCSKKCYNFRLAKAPLGAAYCMSQGQPTLLLVVHYDSQVVCAAVHQYSHLIQNFNPPSPP